MACQFCGKEIGPIRILRDKEFCSPKHRKEYKDRLRKVLVQVGEPQTVPTAVAPFMDATRPCEQTRRASEASFDFSSSSRRAKLPNSWTLSIPEAGASLFARLDLTACEFTAPARAFSAEAAPYFGHSTVSSMLALPEPKLGAVLLRSTDGQLLSEPIALRYPETHGSAGAPQLPAPTPLPKPAQDLSVPEFFLGAADCTELAEPAASTSWMALDEPNPLLSTLEPSISGPATPALHLPVQFPAPAVPPAPVHNEFETPPPVFEKRMIVPRPEAVVRTVLPVTGDTLKAAAELRLPGALPAAPVSPRPAAHLEPVAIPTAQGVNIEARMSMPACAPIPPAPALPQIGQLQIWNPALPAGKREWMSLPEGDVAEREVAARADVQAVAFPAMALRVAPFAIEAVRDPVPEQVEEVPTKPATPRKAALRAVDPAPVPALPKTIELAPAAKVSLPPVAAAGQAQTEVPQAGLLPLDYRSADVAAQPRPNLFWNAGRSGLQMPRFGVRPVFDRLEDPSKQKEERKRPAFAEIFTMPDAAALTKRKGARHAITAIAASVTVVMALWFGANAGKFGKDLINREAADEIAAAARPQLSGAGSASGSSAPSSTAPEPSPLKHPVAWIKTEAAKRATVQVADSFENGMQAWGAKTKGLAPGWSRSSDGYVRPGALALFQPTLSFTDYRMEFFGQIEDKSMSWVVRGKDKQNYYAMKFNIVEPGLRPVIAMVHYPVVGGKQGHKVEVPLSVMVHNNTPYHVAVDVRGNHYTASIEGQEVDSWSDDTLLAGGVGFFAEAGSRARIYWMKVSKNDDWFGRLCNQIAGGSGPQDTAWLERPAAPAPRPQPPAPEPATAALWPAETGETGFASTQRGKGSVKGEMERWSS